MNKVILITGCGSENGLGHHTAEQLKAQGHIVYATTRETLDVGSEVAIQEMVDQIIEEQGRIDVLINNAATATLGAIEQIDMEAAFEEFQTNYFGPLRMIQAVLPQMRQQQSGQIINICTVFCNQVCPPGFGVHLASKAALERAGEALASEVAPFGIQVTNFEPGSMKTSFVRRKGHRMHEPYEELVEKSFNWFAQETPHFEMPEEVASRLVQIIESEHPPLHEASSNETREYMASHASDPFGEQQLEEYAKYIQ
jgi:NAD(P)-dependent dehydrogenase (short-subunit alcohol dehydrogenase family)